MLLQDMFRDEREVVTAEPNDTIAQATRRVPGKMRSSRCAPARDACDFDSIEAPRFLRQAQVN